MWKGMGRPPKERAATHFSSIKAQQLKGRREKTGARQLTWRLALIMFRSSTVEGG
ncbi:MAG: hypothetical protein IJU71_04585 [Selenomonadaceae bacterium]|nr:hypothetical protein [Selenomonadaceae bacterium]